MREAEADGNFVLTADGGLVEVQATAEKRPMRPEEVDALMALAKLGCAGLFKAQTEALGDRAPAGLSLDAASRYDRRHSRGVGW